MATIKTIVDEANVRRVITKLVDEERKVSCACCTPTVCCPWPADQLGAGYTENDLPDTIDVLLATSPTTSQRFLMSRNGSEYGPVAVTYTDALGSKTSDAYVIVETFVSELEWFILLIAQVGGSESLDAISPCLLDLNAPDQPNFIEDTFEDTYSITGPVSGTVTRQSRCVWSGTGLTLSNFGYQWKVNGRNKSGNQNTPVGSYADGYSVL